jgi:hypothetical protein
MDLPGHGGHALVAATVLVFGIWVFLAARRGEPGPVRPNRDPDGPPVRTLAAASLLAGAAHAWATPHHVTEYALYGIFFVVVTVGQVAFAAAVLRPGAATPRTLLVAAFGNIAILATWVLSRTVGVPIGPHSTPEAVGPVDLTAAVAELLLVALSVAWLAVRKVPPRPESAAVRSAFPV